MAPVALDVDVIQTRPPAEEQNEAFTPFSEPLKHTFFEDGSVVKYHTTRVRQECP